MRANALARFLATNLGWMAAAIFLAAAIWTAANMASNPVEQDELRNIQARVTLPDGFVITSREPDASTVTAVIRASQSEWDLLVPSDLLITADLSHIREPGEYRVELEAEMASQRRARVVALRPSSWILMVGREAEKRMAIQVIVTNDPPLGYTYPPDLTCDETEVVVSGSADAVLRVARVEARLNLGDELNPVSKNVNLTAALADGLRAPDVTLAPAAVTCDVDIQPREDVFQMPVLPKTTGSPPPGYDFKDYALIEPDTVALTGDRNAILSLPGLVRTVPVDLTGKTETFTVDAALDLPPGVQTVPENQMIRVTVRIEPQVTTRQFEDVPVEVTGLDPTQFRATGLADTVTVFVSGPPGQLPEQDGVRVIVDLSGLPPGNHQVRPQGMITAGDASALTISVSPDTLSVTIEALNPPTSPSTPAPTPDRQESPG
jgi:YbbR domain-containing protein